MQKHVLKQEFFLFPKEIPLSIWAIKILADYAEYSVVRNCYPRFYCTEQDRTIILYIPSYLYNHISWHFFFLLAKNFHSKLFM